MLGTVTRGYGSTPCWQLVLGVDLGLGWVRRRQRSLTRGVLALFCAAWLQAAVVPCVMAHTDEPVAPAPAPAHQHHDGHAGHDHAGTMPEPHEARTAHPCLYCPPGESGDRSCDGHGGCAYPHEPQVDARAAGAIFAALPVSFVVPAPGALVIEDRLRAPVIEVVPKVSLSVTYCRFIE